MTTLRIYGDSYGAPFEGSGWPNMLSKKLGAPVINTAIPGASTEYAALKLARDIQRNLIKDGDIVIFVPSTPGRLHLDYQIRQDASTAATYLHGDKQIKKEDHPWFFENRKHIEWLLVNQSHDINLLNHESYLNLIRQVALGRPECLFIVLKNSDWRFHIPVGKPSENFLMPNILLNEISQTEVEGYVSYFDFVEHTQVDVRANHLTVPNLTILADLLFESINTRSVDNFTYDKFKSNVIKKIHSKEEYHECVNKGLLTFQHWILDRIG
jgi:hypothetical protein